MRKDLQGLADFATVFKTFEQLEKANLLSFDQKNRRLFIEQPLAIVMMAGDVEKWKAFINNAFIWLYHRQCTEAWENFLLKEELNAVRLATKEHSGMTRADVERVRRQRRDEILESDMKAPKIEPFEFFVVREANRDEAAKAGSKDSVPAGTILAVGRYDMQSEQLEMAAWEDVKALFNHKK